MQLTHIIPTNGAILNPVVGTLRRGLVPPPDVTHHTTNHSKSTHDLHGAINLQQQQQQPQPISAHLVSNNSMVTSAKPQSILKDPNRKQQHIHPNMQILNVQNAPGIGGMGNLIGNVGSGGTIGVGTYDPNTHNLSSFNTSLGYTDADGHLV